MSYPVHKFYEAQFRTNLELMGRIQRESGAKMLMAFKGYIPWHSVRLIKSHHISGVAASSLFEARKAHDSFPFPCHVYCPAYIPSEFEQLQLCAEEMVFNSMGEYGRYVKRTHPSVNLDLRVNLQHIVVSSTIFDGYNPNRPFSRFGVTRQNMPSVTEFESTRISGLHFHCLNQQKFEDLKEMVEALESAFGEYLHLPQVKRLNMGGGHAFTDPAYDIDGLIDMVKYLRAKYNIDVYMEPSEYIYRGVGTLEATVLDIVHNEVDIAILNVSAKNHMPDILESPYYFAPLKEGEYEGAGDHKYLLTGNTCLTGDVIGQYSFDKPLKVGQILTFTDQTAYTLTQSTFFNGVNKPRREVIGLDGQVRLRRQWEYEDFEDSL